MSRTEDAIVAGSAGAEARQEVRQEVRQGWRIAMPACVAVLPLGLALGVLVVHSGLPWWCAPLLAAVVFAGSLEFLLVGMLAAAAPLSQIAATALLVNFRHVFYALSFPLHRVRGLGPKAYSTFALTDEAYALTTPSATAPSTAGWTRARILTIQASFHLVWVCGVTFGAAVGSLIPPPLVGLDFAVTALFTVLSIEAYLVQRSVPLPILALACAIVAHLLAPGDMLVIAMGLFVAALAGSYLLSHRTSHA
jgi:4-azaleucine resistance transporter AzlC